MKHSDYVITGAVKNLGRVDGTTRDTWIATVRLAQPVGAQAVEHSGSGKDPGVAMSRAARDAVDAMLRHERNAP